MDAPTLTGELSDELTSRGHSIYSAMKAGGHTEETIKDALYAVGEVDSPTQAGNWSDDLSPRGHAIYSSMTAAGHLDTTIKDTLDQLGIKY